MKVFNLLLLLLITTNVFAERSSKRTSEITVSIGCVAGLATGLYMDSEDKNEDKSSIGTLGLNTALGCILGLAYSAIFGSDDQELLVRKNDQQARQIQDLEQMIRKSTHRGSDKAKFLDSLALERNFQGPEALQKLVRKDCVPYRFYLGFKGRELDNLYIPVDGYVVTKAIEYYVFKPKNPDDQAPCVSPIQPYGYLSLELPGLGDMFFNHATSVLKKQQEKVK